MNTIYWITRLDGLNVLMVTLLSIAIIVAVGGLVWKFCICADGGTDEIENQVRICNKVMRILFPIAFILLLLVIFVPTTKEAYQIYGIGGTIDYLKSNKESSKLPDKAVKALNCFLDRECSEQSDTTTTKNIGYGYFNKIWASGRNLVYLRSQNKVSDHN